MSRSTAESLCRLGQISESQLAALVQRGDIKPTLITPEVTAFDTTTALAAIHHAKRVASLSGAALAEAEPEKADESEVEQEPAEKEQEAKTPLSFMMSLELDQKTGVLERVLVEGVEVWKK